MSCFCCPPAPGSTCASAGLLQRGLCAAMAQGALPRIAAVPAASVWGSELTAAVHRRMPHQRGPSHSVGDWCGLGSTGWCACMVRTPRGVQSANHPPPVTSHWGKVPTIPAAPALRPLVSTEASWPRTLCPQSCCWWRRSRGTRWGRSTSETSSGSFTHVRRAPLRPGTSEPASRAARMKPP